MIVEIEIAGKEYPVSFGNATIVSFETKTGVSIDSLQSNLPFTNSLRLFFEAMRVGHRRAKAKFSMTFDDFCDLLDEDPDAIARLSQAFRDSNPVEEEGEKKVKSKKEAD